jgi:hypothetical protein
MEFEKLRSREPLFSERLAESFTRQT